MLNLLTLRLKIAIIAGVIVAAVIAWQWEKHQIGSEAVSEFSDELKQTDHDTLKNKAKNDAEIRNEPDSDLLDRFRSDGL